MNSALPRPPTVPRWVAAISGPLSLLGLADLVLTGVLGFETPNPVLLATSGALVFAAPLAVLWHFAAKPALTSKETCKSGGCQPTGAASKPQTFSDSGSRFNELAAAHRGQKESGASS